MKTLIIVAVVVVIGVAWSLWGYFSSNVEQAKYTVIKKASDYEVREYPAHIVAQATVSGSYDEALNQGFKIVASYIFGGNIKQQGIAMTAPVLAEQNTDRSSEKIAMTAPVMATNDSNNSWTISFGMPSGYTLDTLPVPNDKRIKVVEIPTKRFAVLRFSGYATTAKVKKMGDSLVASLSRDNVATVGLPSYAGYNAPWTPPWMTRNEVLVELK